MCFALIRKKAEPRFTARLWQIPIIYSSLILRIIMFSIFLSYINFFLSFRLIVIFNIQVFVLIKDYCTFTIMYIIYICYLLLCEARLNIL